MKKKTSNTRMSGAMDRPDTSIQKFLRPLCFSCAVLLSIFGICSSTVAQGPVAQGPVAQGPLMQGPVMQVPAGQGVYTILGDVQLPATYSWPAGQQVSLQMVLERAGALGPSGIATIRKASQPERTNNVDVRSTSANSTLLSPRDTIVWQSVSGPNLESGNIVFLTDNGPMLQAMTISGVDLATVLDAARLPYDQDVVVYRSRWVEQQRLNLNPRSLVQHGDVLDVRTNSRTGGVVPVSSPSELVAQETPNSVLATTSTPSGYGMAMQNDPSVQQDYVQGNDAGQLGNSFHVPPIPQTGSGLQIPGFQDDSMIGIEANDVPPSPLAGATEPLQIPGSQTGSQLESVDAVFYEVDSSGDAAFASAGTATSGTVTAGTATADTVTAGTATADTVTSGTATADTVTASEATLDQLANEMLQPAAEKESFAFMNGIFLFGLVLAIGLITIGIVRTRQEQRLHDSMRVGAESDLRSASGGTEPRFVETGLMDAGLRDVGLRDTGPTDTGLTDSEVSASESEETSSLADVLPSESFTRLPVFADEESNEQPELVPFFNSPEAEAETETETSQSVDEVELDDCPVLSAGLDGVSSVEEPIVEPLDDDLAFEDAAVVSFQQPVHEEQFVDQPADAEPAAVSTDSSPSLDVRTWLSEDTLEQEAEPEIELTSVDEVCEATDEEVVVGESPVDEPCPDDLTVETAAADLPTEEVSTIEVAASVVEVEEDSLQAELTCDDDAEEPVLELPDVDAIRQTLTQNAVSDIQVPQNQLDETGADETVQETPAARIASSLETLDIPQTSQNQEQNMAQPSMTKAEADYLEDLIQNRLPMELSDAQLPLKISLFGKPEGPRRLRIDAAHTTIAPPHMAKAAGRAKRREPEMAMAAETPRKQEIAQSAESQPVEKQAATENSSSVQRTDSVTNLKDQRPDSQGPASGLDKALNFLEEQSKS